jgi:hypothetical protein
METGNTFQRSLRQTRSKNGRADQALAPEVIKFDSELTMTLQKNASF